MTMMSEAAMKISVTAGYPHAVLRPVTGPASQRKHTRRHQREEQPLGVDHPDEELTVDPGGRQQARPYGLSRDRA